MPSYTHFRRWFSKNPTSRVIDRSVHFLFLVGFVSILGQVVLLRELNVTFYGVELIYILAMGVWLLWSACGAIIGKQRHLPSATRVRALFILSSVLLPAGVICIRGARHIFNAIPGTYLPFSAQLAVISLSLLPLGILLGISFQWAAKLSIAENTRKMTLATAYAIESCGGLFGGFASTLLLQLGFQNLTISLLCGMISFGILLLFNRKKQPLRYGEIFILGLLSMTLLFSNGLDSYTNQWNHPQLIVSKDSPYSRITIVAQSGQFVVFENDVIGFETESTAAEELVHLSAMQHEHPKKVLISGGGIEGIVAEILKHSPDRVDYVELNSILLELVRNHLPPEHSTFLTSKKVHVYHADPREFLNRAGTYDLILSGMPGPFSGQSNRFYTREYFRQCANKLNPKGIFAFRLPSSENIWTPVLILRNAGIYHSLKSAFKDVVVLPGVTQIIIASNDGLSHEPKQLIARFIQREINAKLITPAYIDYLYTNDRFFEIANRLKASRAVRNTDNRPICYQYSTMIWLSKFIPQMIHRDISLLITLSDLTFFHYAILFVALCGIFFLIRCSHGFRRMTLVAIAGFLGMIMQTMLLLTYQTQSGILFQNIGILLMIFMAGLAAGSFAVMKAAKACRRNFEILSTQWGAALLAGFTLLNLAFFTLRYFAMPFGIFIVSMLQFSAAFFVSAIFAVASIAGVKDQQRVVSPLYASDLIGGCLGSLLGTLMLVPFLGMDQTIGILMVVSLASLLLV